MINSRNKLTFHKDSDQFLSYFSSIPELPQFKLKSPKDKNKKIYSLQSLTKDSIKKSTASSKKQYQLFEKKQTSKKKCETNSNNKKLIASADRNIQTTLTLYSPKPASKRSSSYQVSKSLKRSVKTNNSQMQRTRSSGTGSTHKNKICVNQALQLVLQKCFTLLNSYQGKMIQLKEQSRKLQEANHLMMFHLGYHSSESSNWTP